MYSILYYLNYNNYYNRICKKLNPLLGEHLKYTVYKSPNKNFKPNDNIDTFTIENMDADINPDYVLIENYNDDDNVVNFSRWFVLEKTRIRAGQYRLMLHRDLIVENFDEVLNAPAYIEKGYTNNYPYRYNQENFKCNQIKYDEFLLKDKTDCQWICIYCSPDLKYNGEIDDLNIEYVDPYIDYKLDDLEDYTYYQYTTNRGLYPDGINFSYLKNNVPLYPLLLEEDNKVIRIGDYDTGTYYTINVVSYQGAILLAIKEMASPVNYEDKVFRLYSELRTYPYLDGSPYCLITLPYTNFYNSKYTYNKYYNKHFVLQAVEQLKNKLADNIYDIQILPYCPRDDLDLTYNQYDSTSEKYFDNVTSQGQGYLTKTNDIYYLNFYNVVKNSRSLILNIPFDYDDFISDIHKGANLYFARICSPQYSSSYEFIPSYLEDYADKTNKTFKIPFTIDLNFKPYQPYIHISPIFRGLYGVDVNDINGLVVNDNFSIEQTTSAWSEYVLNNKNYQAVFNRQIENMNINQNYNMAENIFGAVTGTAMGAIAGGIAGGPAGAVVGGVASAAGGIADIATGVGKYQETLDYTKDMYNMNIQNVKARPDTLAAQTSITFNTKPYPFLELYKTTTAEELDFEEKIKYNGMTINAISNILTFLQNGIETYVKAKLIRLDTINNDTNYLNALAQEVNKGFFITYKWEDDDE